MPRIDTESWRTALWIPRDSDSHSREPSSWSRAVIAGSIWIVATATLGFRLYRDSTRAPVFDDLRPVWTGVSNFLHHQPVYGLHPDLQNYLYPPSSLVLLSPIGLVDYNHVRVASLFVEVATIFLAAALSLRLVGIRWTPISLGLVLLGLMVFQPVRSLLDVRNLDSVVVLLEVVALLAMARRRWLIGGIVLGLAFSLKSTTLPLLLIPLVMRRWSSSAAAVVTSALLTVAGMMLGTDGERFFTSTVPYLSGGQAPLHVWNVSLAGAVSLIGLPSIAAAPFRVLVVVMVAVLIWRELHRSDVDGPMLIAQLSGLVLLGTFLAFSYSFGHYFIYLLPLLASFLRHDWAVDRRLALVGVLCIAIPDVPGQIIHSATLYWTSRLLYTVGCLLLVGAFLGLVRRPAVARPGPLASNATAASVSRLGHKASTLR